MRRSVLFAALGISCFIYGAYGTGSEIKDAAAMIAAVVYLCAAGICQLIEEKSTEGSHAGQ